MAPPKPIADGWTEGSGLPPNFIPECPRCGYDLSGQAGVARDQSPRPPTGTCSECGLEFEWRLVLSPGLAGWLWFIESAGKRLTRACVTTTWRALNPMGFWRDVRLKTQVVPSRIARWVITTFGILIFTLAVLVFAQALAFATLATRTVTWSRPVTRPLNGNFTMPTPTGLTGANISAVQLKYVIDVAKQDLVATWSGNRWMPPRGPVTLTWALGATLTAPLIVLALPHTRARAKVRGVHILRASAYSFCWLAVLCLWSVALRTVELALTIRDILSTANPNTLGWSFTMRSLPFSAMSGGSAIVAALIIAFWLTIYWTYALARGWRMRENDSLPAMFSIIACSVLGGLAFMFWIGELLP